MSIGLKLRATSLTARIEALGGLRALVSLTPAHDLAPRQWQAIESQLSPVRTELLARLKRGLRQDLAEAHQPAAARRLNALMGQTELDLSRAYGVFDLYADLLTQRHSPELGLLLAGCDRLAADALHRPHPALEVLQCPLVHCDQGFGASIFREGVQVRGLPPNALPLIQIPYSRLNSEKYNLTSVQHEVGHQALTQLKLLGALGQTLGRAAAGWGAELSRLFSLWAFEIGPDFWAFGLSGLAQAAGVRDILALPPTQVFHVSSYDPHPPPYLRALLGFEWCRQVWGRGPWDAWEQDWLTLYPLETAGKAARVLAQGRRALPTVAQALLDTRFITLDKRPLSALFDLGVLAPDRLERAVGEVAAGRLNLRGLPSGAHLAVFRLIRDQRRLSEDALDRTMGAWLTRLGQRRLSRHAEPAGHTSAAITSLNPPKLIRRA